MPNKPGVYYARGRGFQHWNFMVLVYGQSPFLKTTIFNKDNCKVTTHVDIFDLEEFYYCKEPPAVDFDNNSDNPLSAVK